MTPRDAVRAEQHSPEGPSPLDRLLRELRAGWSEAAGWNVLGADEAPVAADQGGQCNGGDRARPRTRRWPRRHDPHMRGVGGRRRGRAEDRRAGEGSAVADPENKAGQDQSDQESGPAPGLVRAPPPRAAKDAQGGLGALAVAGWNSSRDDGSPASRAWRRGDRQRHQGNQGPQPPCRPCVRSSLRVRPTRNPTCWWNFSSPRKASLNIME
jgi:hypothetical protein